MKKFRKLRKSVIAFLHSLWYSMYNTGIYFAENMNKEEIDYEENAGYRAGAGDDRICQPCQPQAGRTGPVLRKEDHDARCDDQG